MERVDEIHVAFLAGAQQRFSGKRVIIGPFE